MTDFDDLRLDRTEEPAPAAVAAPASRFPLWLLIGAGAVAGALLGLWYMGVGRKPAPPPPAASADTTVDIAPPKRVPAEPGDLIDLPPLDQSDAIVRSLISKLSSHPQVAAWLATDDLVRTMTVVVARIASGQSPAKQVNVLRPVGKFGVRASGGDVYLDPASYHRYDDLASAVESLDARGVARFYATVKPRIDDAWRELGVADEDFDRTLERAIVMLLRTPVVEGDVRLRASSVSYTFADPALEGLTKAQRQFLRMGPRNMRVVKAKLRDVARYLGIPEASLPSE